MFMMKNYSNIEKRFAFLSNLFYTTKASTGNAMLLLCFLGLFLANPTQTYSQITQRGTATSAAGTSATTITINKPSGVVEGDIMLVNIGQEDNNTLANPSLLGWTVAAGTSNNNAGTSRRATVLYKIATATEGSNYTFALNNSSGNVDHYAGAIVAFSGVNCTTPIDITGAYSTANASTVNAASITTTTANAAVLMFGMAGDNENWSNWSATTPATLNELYDVNNGSSITVGAAWAIRAAAGATGVGAATLTDNERNAGILIGLRRASAPTITSFTPANGCPGSSVTINGSNLSSASSVTIGGVAATITSSICSSITATIGASASGTSAISVTTAGGSTNSASNFTVNALPTVTLTSAVGTNNQTRCINTLLTSITYSISGGGATGATVTGLPTGVNFLYAAGTLTISGTPSASGTFNYTVSTTGGTCTGTATGSITVSTVPTITLTSAGATTNQTLCQNTAITNITYSIGGSATGVTPSGLPAGVNGNLVGSVYTISGTPSASGTFNYTLTTSGTGACPAATASGTINVNAAPATPVITSNSPQCNPAGVTISQTGSAPAGQTWYWQGTTSGGTSTANSAATYTANTSGTYYIRSRNNITGCWSVEASIAVIVNNSISTLATPTSPTNGATGVCYSGSGTTTQISWAAAAGATGYDVYFGTSTPAPTLVSSNQAGTTWTITPVLAAGTTYYWRIVPRNSCGLTTGTPINWSFTTSGAVCYCTPPATGSSTRYIDSVTASGTLINNSNLASGYSAGGYGNFSATTIATQIPGAGINFDVNFVGGQLIRTYVDWNSNGDFTDAGESVYSSGGTTLSGATTFGIVVPSGQAVGNYRIRIVGSSNTTVDSCTITGSGEAEDYTIAVVADCPAKITSVTDGSACGTGNTVLLTAVGNGVTTSYRWYTTATGGTAIAGATSSTYTTPPLASTTTYYVTASNELCETTYRVPVKAIIKTTTNIIITPSTPNVCGDSDIISITAAGDTTEEDILLQDFESGIGTWTVATSGFGAGADTPWSVKTSPYQPTTTVVWKPAVNSGAVGSIGNNFAFTTSDYSGSNFVTTMTSPIINTALLPSYTSLTLTFDHYYSYFSGDSGTVEVSINGGAFTAVTPTPALYNSDLGAASTFVGQTVDLNAYALPSTTSLQFRFVYSASFDDGWALDNIKLFGVRPLNTTFAWGAGANAYLDAGATITYNPGAPDFHTATTIYVKPDSSQINNSSWAFTATATLSNGCSVVKNITVANNTKIWTGSSSQLWNDANNWIPVGVPTASHCVVLPSNTQITGSGFNAEAKTLTVKSTGNLELQSSNTLTVTDAVTVDAPGIFNIRNNASLIQINPVANTGNINMQRTAFVDFRDYVYWSTPVSPFHASNISLTSNNTSLYKWIPTIVGNGAGNFGNWTSGNETMVAGLGYIERGLNTAPLNAPANFTSTLTGVPNNGNISVGISRGTYNTVGTYPSPSSPTNATQDDDNWNLLGNPYPSAISAKDFLTANATNLDGFVKIWRHGIAPSSLASDPFYNNYVYNYDSSDYLTYNLSGPSSQSGFDGYIGAGQGFITRMLPTSPTASSTAVFNNTMRSNAYRNDQFYKSAAANRTNENTEGRIWIDLVSSNANITTLVAYVNGATNQKDQMYDAMTDIKATFNIYSLLEGYDRNTIQGRSLPFNQDDQVPLGIKIAANGNYTIAIQGLDGFFAETNQAVYLEDKLLNVIHDLRSAPYSFTSTSGEYLDRFVLRYTQASLSNNDFDYTNSVKIFANNRINIISAIEPIKEIKVYDLLGKLLTNKTNVSKNELVLNELNPTLSTLIVKVTLENNTVITKKVIF